MPYFNSRRHRGTPERVFCYVRVSSDDQAHGASLAEQRRIIHEFCKRRGLVVKADIEDIESAAKAGRTGFTEMVKRLAKREADGVVFHKVDRSSRNFRDWVTISDIMDQGHYIAFASEGLDSSDPGGRLTMDILAATAVHFIRNLRSEVVKGLEGRARQGYWPRNAPFGYLNPPSETPKGERGRKIADPERAPIIRELFELYATGAYTLDELTAVARKLRLTSKSGAFRTRSRIAKMLDNPFYAGFVPYHSELYPGLHEAIVPAKVFAAVQAIRTRRKHPHVFVAEPKYVYQRLCRCHYCGRFIIAERKRGHVYYRCHTRGHPSVCLREEVLDAALERDLAGAVLSQAERDLVVEVIERMYADEGRMLEETRARIRFELNEKRTALERLTRSYINGLVEEDSYAKLKTELVVAVKDLEVKLDEGNTPPAVLMKDRVLAMLDAPSARFRKYEKEKRRTLLMSMYSNIVVEGKSVSTEPKDWLGIVLGREEFPASSP